METQKRSTLRERTRQAVQGEIAAAAVQLFVEQGYHETTIDDIAAAAGMSQRSVFRYFATKEDIVIGKLEAGIDNLLDSFRSRPMGESVWESLTGLITQVHSDAQIESDGALLQLMFQTPALFSVYLQKLQSLQDAVVLIFLEREATAHRVHRSGGLELRALTAAAFSCFVAAQREAVDRGQPDSVGALIEQALRAIAPATDSWPNVSGPRS